MAQIEPIKQDLLCHLWHH